MATASSVIDQVNKSGVELKQKRHIDSRFGQVSITVYVRWNLQAESTYNKIKVNIALHVLQQQSRILVDIK